MDTTAGRFRSGFSRCAIGSTSLTTYTAYSQAFNAGVQANLWAAARVFPVGFTFSGSFFNVFGVVSSANPGKGLWVQAGASGKAQLVKVDSSTTVLATEGGTSFTSGGLHRVDIRIQNYGASGTVTVWIDLNQVLTFTGNIAVAGTSGLDQIGISNTQSNGQQYSVSEVIAADEDTRALVLVTLAPNALGTTDAWTGTFTDINEVTLSDATVNTVNTVGQLQQYALSDLPAGNFAVKAVVISARATAPAGSASNSVQLGVQTGSGTDVGAAQAPGTGLVTLSRIMATDPTTGSQWLPATVNAMQLVMKSGA